MSVVAALFAMGANAQASSIIGGLTISGTLAGSPDLSSNKTPVSAGGGITNAGGAFSSLAPDFGSFPPTFTAVNFAAFTWPIGPNPPVTLWTVNTGSDNISFTLTSAHLVGSASNNGYTLAGLGNFTGTAAGDTSTLASFSFATTHPSNSSQWGYTAAFSSPVVTSTPLPAALFFVAPALAGVFGFSRRKNGAKSAA